MEAMFERHSPPALYLARNAMLSSFACGRQTSLVIDAGHAATVGAFFLCMMTLHCSLRLACQHLCWHDVQQWCWAGMSVWSAA